MYNFSYDLDYGHIYGMAAAILILVVVVFAVSVVVYFTFLNRKNEGRFTGFAAWLYDFLSFRKLMIEGLLKILYMASALIVTAIGLISIFTGSFGSGLLIVLGGNVLARITFEYMLILIMICKNTSEISRKLGGNVKNVSFEDGYQQFDQLSRKARETSTARTVQVPVQNQQPQQDGSSVQPQYQQDPQTDSQPGTTADVPGDNAPANQGNVCPNCGCVLADDAVFCTSCGTKIR